MVASPSRRTTNRPWKGRGYVTWDVLNFGCPIHTSGMAEARALKFFYRTIAMLNTQLFSARSGEWAQHFSNASNPFIKCFLSLKYVIITVHRTFCYRPSLVSYNWWAVQYSRFFTARRYAKCSRPICRRRVSVRLSVCVSVISRYCIKTAKHIITQIMPHDRVFKWDVL